MDTVSFVFQDSHLLKTSVLENVRMARPDASREEVLHALNAAQCMDIVKKLPQGIDTVIGADGVYLSGGEMQRLSIARAVLKDAPILILDEATAFADPDHEVQVQQALSALSKGKTVLMIAHRLSSVTDADCICVMQDGRIAEKGSGRNCCKKTACSPICGNIILRLRNGKSERRNWYDPHVTETFCFIPAGSQRPTRESSVPASCRTFPLCSRWDFYTFLSST